MLSLRSGLALVIWVPWEATWKGTWATVTSLGRKAWRPGCGQRSCHSALTPSFAALHSLGN